MDSQEDLGKFWFDMYQRVKAEIAKERGTVVEMQAELRDKEEELSLVREKVYLMSREEETSERVRAGTVDRVVGELREAERGLKGEFLGRVIRKIEERKGSIEEVVMEVVALFKTLLKQLQATQKELNRVKKSVPISEEISTDRSSLQ